MALVLEDGTGLANSNTYTLEATFDAWLLDRGYVLSGDTSTEALLHQSIDYLETLNYIGFKNTQSQALLWPRSGVHIDGYSFASDEIPKQLIDSQFQIAFSIDQGVNPMATVERATKSEKVDVIEVVYQDDASTTDIITSVNRTLRKLLESTGASFTANRKV